MYFEGNEATVNRYDAQASGASDWSVVWGGRGRSWVVVVVVVVGGRWGSCGVVGGNFFWCVWPMYLGAGGCVWIFLGTFVYN